MTKQELRNKCNEVIKEIENGNNIIDDIIQKTYNLTALFEEETGDFKYKELEYAYFENLLNEYQFCIFIEGKVEQEELYPFMFVNLHTIQDYTMLDGYGNFCDFSIHEIKEMAIDYIKEVLSEVS